MNKLEEFYGEMGKEQLEFELLWTEDDLVGLSIRRAELNREWATLQEHRDYLVKRLGEYSTMDQSRVVPDVGGRDL